MISVGIVGSRGFIGSELAHCCTRDPMISKVVRIDRNILELKDDELKHFVRSQNLDIIVNSAQPSIQNLSRRSEFVDQCLKLNKALIRFLLNSEKQPIFVNLASLWSFPEVIGPIKETDFWEGQIEKERAWFSYPLRLFSLQLEYLASENVITQYSLVLGNVFGANDRSNRIIPRLIREMLDGETVIQLAGSGDELRDFIHVRQQVNRIIDCLFCDPKIIGPILNIGGGSPRSVRQLASMISKKVGYIGEVSFTGNQGNVLSPTKDAIMDMSKANEIFQWDKEEASMDFEKSLSSTISEWRIK